MEKLVLRQFDGTWNKKRYGPQFLCDKAFRRVFSIPRHVGKVEITAHKYAAKDRVLISTTRGYLGVDGINKSAYMAAIHTAESWINQGYKYVEVWYEE